MQIVIPIFLQRKIMLEATTDVHLLDSETCLFQKLAYTCFPVDPGKKIKNSRRKYSLDGLLSANGLGRDCSNCWLRQRGYGPSGKRLRFVV
jgi:hypothetical protein